MWLETPEDLAREDRIAQRIADAVGYRQEKYRPEERSSLDRLFFKGDNLVCGAELRSRQDRKFASYPILLIDCIKVRALLEFERLLGVPIYYMVAFRDDGIWSIKIRDDYDYPTNVHGRPARQVRGGAVVNDTRPAYRVPIGEFKKITDWGNLQW